MVIIPRGLLANISVSIASLMQTPPKYSTENCGEFFGVAKSTWRSWIARLVPDGRVNRRKISSLMQQGIHCRDDRAHV